MDPPLGATLQFHEVWELTLHYTLFYDFFFRPNYLSNEPFAFGPPNTRKDISHATEGQLYSPTTQPLSEDSNSIIFDHVLVCPIHKIISDGILRLLECHILCDMAQLELHQTQQTTLAIAKFRVHRKVKLARSYMINSLAYPIKDKFTCHAHDIEHLYHWLFDQLRWFNKLLKKTMWRIHFFFCKRTIVIMDRLLLKVYFIEHIQGVQSRPAKWG